jgi:hypothetical protein
MKFKDLLSGFVRLHVLHQAAEHEIYGQWMIDELARHGYKLSPGTGVQPFFNVGGDIDRAGLHQKGFSFHTWWQPFCLFPR